MRTLKQFLLASALTLPATAFAAPTSVQFGADRTQTPPIVCVYDNSNTCQPLFGIPATGGGGLLPEVQNNTQLAALPSTYASAVLRLGFAAAGDSPAVQFTPKSTCPYNGGFADGGTCVATSDGKFWVIVMPAVANVLLWGAKCDGTTNDSTPIQHALYAARSSILPPNEVCVAGNLQVITNSVFDLNGSVGKTSPGAQYFTLVGSMNNDGNGFKAIIQNGSIVDTDNNTLRTATLTSVAHGGDTTIYVSSKTGFIVGNAIKFPLGTSPVIEHVTKIASVSGTSSPYAVGLKDKVPYSVSSAAVNAGGASCPVNDQLTLSGGVGPPTVLGVYTASGGAATAFLTLSNGLYDTSPGTTGVATLAGTVGDCVGTTANLTFATAAIGTTVSTAYGNLLMDQCAYCEVRNLVLSTAPINLQIQNTASSSPYYTTRDIVDGVNGDTSTIVGLYKSGGVSNSGFYNIDFTANASTGNGVAGYSDSRDYGGAPPGGNIWSNVNFAQAETCFLERSPQLDQYPLLVDDNCAFYGHVITGGQQLRFTEHWENYTGPSSGSGGVAFYTGESGLNISVGNMYTSSQVFSWFEDSTTTGSTINKDSWGPVKWFGGGGAYNVGSISVANWTPKTSWTPTDVSGASLSFTGALGTFQTLGNDITYSFTTTYPSTASTANAAVSAPIAAANQTYAYASATCFVSGITPSFVTTVTTSPNSSNAGFVNGTTGANLTNQQLSGATVRCTLTYPAS